MYTVPKFIWVSVLFPKAKPHDQSVLFSKIIELFDAISIQYFCQIILGLISIFLFHFPSEFCLTLTRSFTFPSEPCSSLIGRLLYQSLKLLFTNPFLSKHFITPLFPSLMSRFQSLFDLLGIVKCLSIFFVVIIPTRAPFYCFKVINSLCLSPKSSTIRLPAKLIFLKAHFLWNLFFIIQHSLNP